MNTTHNHTTKNYTNLKRILEDLSGNKFENFKKKPQDLSGNEFENLKHDHKDIIREEYTFAAQGTILTELLGPIKEAISSLITNLGESPFIGIIFDDIVKPFLVFILDHFFYGETCNNNCNINNGIVGKLVEELTDKKIIGDDETLGLLDYYVKAKLMVVGILIGIIVWKTLTLTKKISLFMLGRPN